MSESTLTMTTSDPSPLVVCACGLISSDVWQRRVYPNSRLTGRGLPFDLSAFERTTERTRTLSQRLLSL